MTKHEKDVHEYIDDVLSGKKIVGEEIKKACSRFLKFKEKYDYKVNDANFVIEIFEKIFVHEQGEKLDGSPLLGKPFLLEKWQKFIIYSILSFFKKDSKIRVVNEVFIMLPRKNGKTPFVSGLAFALGLLERKSGAKIFISSATLREAMQSFNFINFNLKYMGEESSFRILDNNSEHSISKTFSDGSSLKIEALVPRDSLVSNIQILDELHEFKSSEPYAQMRKSGKAYTNKLTIGITTAGRDMNSFCYRRMEYCLKIINETIQEDSYFVFIAKAPQDENGEVDFTNPLIHEMANPNYGVTIRPDDMIKQSYEALNDPQFRKEFLSKDLNVYTSGLSTYFNVEEFKASDRKYQWTLEELAKLPIKWYGGADLSVLHDLTAGALYGQYGDVDICITHGFFPLSVAYIKAEEDNIPLFGWKDDGHLTMSNTETVLYDDIVNWFIKMRDMGFDISQVGYDIKFSDEFFNLMKSKGFRMINEPQLYIHKSQGFRRIENKVKNKQFYYLSSQAYEYCISNVQAVEKVDGAIQYSKFRNNSRIDLFDASVFACMRMLKDVDREKQIKGWLGD